jgi:hypothetical protein
MPSAYSFGPVTNYNRGVHVRCTPVISEQVRLILNPDTFIESTMMLQTIETEVDKCFREIVDSSPVDEGDYQLSWVRENSKRGNTYRFVIKNEGIPYAKFLIYGMDINFRRFIRTSRGLTGKTYKYPDPARGIIHDVRRIVWNSKNQMISNLQVRKYTFNWRAGTLRISSNITAKTLFTKGERYL